MDLAQVYEEFFPKIYNFIFYKVMHKQVTEDLTSTVFLKVTENFDSYDIKKGSISTWLFTIAQNTINDYFRSRRIQVDFDDLTNTTALSVDFEEQAAIIRDEDLRELYSALAGLGDLTREIISQKYFGEKSIRKIAKDLNMNESTVSTVHNRGLEKLRKLMPARG
ncbi:MAG: RNA polymerase sigma factor [Oscillospiraceae bacterium]|jgi:RNA polymerase sigma-70 factor (ECF subfamily)|nr:RNA polymerase sigma factor [Oscillospiraceae bacterium]